MHCRLGLLPLLAAPLFAAVIPVSTAAPTPVDVAAADNSFGFRLLNAVQKTVPKGNVILSPVSAALNLSMVLNGADGVTKREMLAALSLQGSEIDAINTANARLIQTIHSPAASVTLSVADSLWIDSRRATFRPDYIKRVRAAYDAELADLDFSKPGAAERINDWASRATQGKIPKVIDKIDPAELLFLVNAVYFKGAWTHKFDKAKTQQHNFRLEGGTATPVQRMAQTNRFEYFETPQIQGIRLPFGDGTLVMEILLPAASSSLEALEGQLTAENWKDWRSRYRQRPGTIELPRFELKSRYQLNDPLQMLGMKRAFESGAAELTGLLSSGSGQSHTGPLSISSVIQSTYWKVDEEGSEAAAVTTTGVRSTAAARPEEPFHMIVDRPFFCAIQDQRSGVLLFVGAIFNPER